MRQTPKAGSAFPCPSCGHALSAVLDSRPMEAGTRRRRMCLACDHRFSTIEQVRVGEHRDAPRAQRLRKVLEAIDDLARRLAELHRLAAEDLASLGGVDGVAPQPEGEADHCGLGPGANCESPAGREPAVNATGP